MQLVFRSNSLSLSQALRAHVDACVAAAMAHVPTLASRARVGVWVRDLNGPRGGVDKACAVVLRSQRETVCVEARDADVYTAVTRCAGRLAQVLERRAQRKHTLRVRGGGRHG